MRAATIQIGWFILSLGLVALPSEDSKAGEGPAVRITWPEPGRGFRVGTTVKIKVDVMAPAAVAAVEFRADDRVIGLVTNAPLAITWGIDFNDDPNENWRLEAAVIDHTGGTTKSDPVWVHYFTGRPVFPVLRIISPIDGEMLPAPANFKFSAELLASAGDSGDVDFFAGTNLVGHVSRSGPFTASTPPYSVQVTNLAAGAYQLRAKYLGGDWPLCECLPVTISVVKLGITRATLNSSGVPKFEAVTSFPGRPHVVVASTDLFHWAPVSTNHPDGNTFAFTAASVVDERVFFKVTVPP